MIWLQGIDDVRALVDERKIKPLYARTQATPQAWPFSHGGDRKAEPARVAVTDGKADEYGAHMGPGDPIGLFGSYGGREFTDSEAEASVWVLSASSLMDIRRSEFDGLDEKAVNEALDAGKNVYVGSENGRLTVGGKGVVCRIVGVFSDHVTVAGVGNRAAVDSDEEPEPPVKKTYRVTYTDGCNGEAFADEVHEAEEGSETPAFGGRAEREGYDFKGWEPEVAATVSADATYTAKWEKRAEPEPEPPTPTTHTVTFDTGDGGKVEAQTVEDGAKATRPEDPAWDGHVFEGWYKDPAFSEEFDFEAPVTGDVMIYAKWSEVQKRTFTVSFDSNGGSAVEPQTVTEGEAASRPADPEKSGSRFMGWSLDGRPYDFTEPVTGDIELLAAWKFVWKVTYTDGCGGEAFADSVFGDLVDGTATPAFDGTPTRAGWVFDGWTPKVAVNVTADATYTAKWAKPVVGLNGKEYATVAAAFNDINDGDTATLTADSSETATVRVPKGVSATLNLAGHALKSARDVLTVDGELTIKGDGVVASTKNRKAAVINNGTLRVEGGTITREGEDGTADSSGTNSYYTVLNHGTMVVSGGSVENQGLWSSCVSNGWYDGSQNKSKAPSTLKVTGGSIRGGINAVKNDDWGVLEVSGGSIEGGSIAVMNWNEAKFTGGTVKAGKDGLFANGYIDDESDKGILTVEGGDFTVGNADFVRTGDGAKNPGTVKVSGGTFDVKVDDGLLADGCTQAKDSDGKWEVRKG